jgi:hypothetical protein
VSFVLGLKWLIVQCDPYLRAADDNREVAAVEVPVKKDLCAPGCAAGWLTLA